MQDQNKKANAMIQIPNHPMIDQSIPFPCRQPVHPVVWQWCWGHLGSWSIETSRIRCTGVPRFIIIGTFGLVRWREGSMDDLIKVT
jgi:hypothetical protein